MMLEARAAAPGAEEGFGSVGGGRQAAGSVPLFWDTFATRISPELCHVSCTFFNVGSRGEGACHGQIARSGGGRWP